VSLKARGRALFIQLLMGLMSILSLYPLYFILVTSLKSQREYVYNLWAPPMHPTLANFVEVFLGSKMPKWFVNSLIITVVTVGVSTIVAAMGAYAIARGRFWGHRAVFNTMVGLLVVPPVILVVPMFILMVRVGLINTFSGVIFFYAGLLIPFSVYLLVNFFRTLPEEVFDAALIDGCSPLVMLWRIVMPLAAPALITLIVVNAVWVWNELFIALVFLQKEELRTLMAGLALFQGRYSTNQPLIMAGSLVGLLPALVLYLFGQRYFIRGLTAGSFR